MLRLLHEPQKTGFRVDGLGVLGLRALVAGKIEEGIVGLIRLLLLILAGATSLPLNIGMDVSAPCIAGRARGSLHLDEVTFLQGLLEVIQNELPSKQGLGQAFLDLLAFHLGVTLLQDRQRRQILKDTAPWS